MNHRSIELLLPLLASMGVACAHGEARTVRDDDSLAASTPDERASGTPAATPADPSTATPPSPVERAVASELARRGVTASAVLVETVDLDGDGVEDSVFQAGTDVGCVVARGTGDAIRVDVLAAPLGTAPGVTRCLPVVRTAAGAVLAVAADNGILDMRQGLLQLFVVPTDSEPTLAYQEMFPFVADWTLRASAADGIELVAQNAQPASVPGTIRKHLRLDPSARWVSASCWAEQPTDFPTAPATCSITLPEGARERRLEQTTFGPPVFAGTAWVLSPGAAAATPRAPRTWCVRFEDGRSAWVELPRAVTASCDARTP